MSSQQILANSDLWRDVCPLDACLTCVNGIWMGPKLRNQHLCPQKCFLYSPDRIFLLVSCYRLWSKSVRNWKIERNFTSFVISKLKFLNKDLISFSVKLNYWCLFMSNSLILSNTKLVQMIYKLNPIEQNPKKSQYLNCKIWPVNSLEMNSYRLRT